MCSKMAALQKELNEETSEKDSLKMTEPQEEFSNEHQQKVSTDGTSCDSSDSSATFQRDKKEKRKLKKTVKSSKEREKKNKKSKEKKEKKRRWVILFRVFNILFYSASCREDMQFV